MRHLLLVVSLILSVLAATMGTAAERAIVVLDGSGSMWAQIEGKARIEIARETLAEVLGNLPDDLELGFMSYGHRTRGDCDDIELIVQPGAGTGQQIIEAAARVSPRGKTPLSEAVRQAAEGLSYTEDKATVILITDGIETCDADPCAVGNALEAAGIDFTAHIIGFGLSDAEGQAVACLAENTGGRYLGASDGADLVEALTATVAQVSEPTPVAEPEPEPEPEPKPVDPDNFQPTVSLAEGDDPMPVDTSVIWEIYRAASDGSAGEWVTTEYGNTIRTSLEPGDYVITAQLGAARVSQPLTITDGDVARPHFVLNAGLVTLRPLPAPDAEPADGAGLTFHLPDGGTTTHYGPSTVYLPAGDQKVDVTIGRATVQVTFPLAAGEILEKDVVLGVGRAVLNAYYVPGMKVEDGGLAVEIFEARKALDGSRKLISYGYGPDTGHDLPAGDYVLVAKMNAAVAETPFTVTVGELTEVDIVLDAGVLAITAPGAEFTRVLGKADIAGNRKEFGYSFQPEYQITLTAGDYTVRVEAAGTATDTPVTVVAGERTEITIP